MLKTLLINNRRKRNDKFNQSLKKRLTNQSPTILSNNCIGGVISHNLGLRFNSPTVNLYFTPADFVLYLRYLDAFSATELTEVSMEGVNYPIGCLIIPEAEIRIYFQHYATFEEAKEKWEERSRRIDRNNLYIFFEEGKGCEQAVLKEFEELPYRNKIVLSNGQKSWLSDSFPFAIYGRRYCPGKLLNFGITNYGSKRYLDRFDYVEFLNHGCKPQVQRLKLTHFISTMGRTSFDFLKDMHLVCDATLVNQKAEKNFTEEINSGYSVKIHHSTDIGLSKSRNLLLSHAVGDIAILTDDDLSYVKGYECIIQNAYRRNPGCDMLIFHFSESDEQDTRPKFKKETKVSLFNCSKISSAEITFKIESVRKAGLCFDELIGLGTRFRGGEDNAFIADALRAGLKIKVIPVTICITHLVHDMNKEEKTESNLHETLNYKGAAFYRIYGRNWFLFGIAFLFLKKKTVFRQISYVTAFRWMYEGKRDYRKEREAHVF